MGIVKIDQSLEKNYVALRWRELGLADYVYLQGYCHLREDERSFRLDRIVDMRVDV